MYTSTKVMTLTTSLIVEIPLYTTSIEAKCSMRRKDEARNNMREVICGSYDDSVIIKQPSESEASGTLHMPQVLYFVLFCYLVDFYMLVVHFFMVLQPP